MAKRLSYNDVYETIAMYANELLPRFADAWERFPQEDIAADIAKGLCAKAESWNNLNKDVAERIADAAREIAVRASL